MPAAGDRGGLWHPQPQNRWTVAGKSLENPALASPPSVQNERAPACVCRLPCNWALGYQASQLSIKVSMCRVERPLSCFMLNVQRSGVRSV